MWPLAVVVVDADAEDMLELAAVEDQEPVEAFRANRTDEPFGDRVRPRCSHRRLNDPDAFAAEDLIGRGRCTSCLGRGSRSARHHR